MSSGVIRCEQRDDVRTHTGDGLLLRAGFACSPFQAQQRVSREEFLATKKAVYVANLELKGACFPVKLRAVGICFILHTLAFLQSILPFEMKIAPCNTIVTSDYITMNVYCQNNRVCRLARPLLRRHERGERTERVTSPGPQEWWNMTSRSPTTYVEDIDVVARHIMLPKLNTCGG